MMDILSQTLFFALARKRPYSGQGEHELRVWLHDQFPDSVWDEDGNLILDLRRDETSRTAFMAHLDTVHRLDGKLDLELAGDLIRVKNGGVLGADDGAGCAILAHMAQAEVPGLYLWTTGEECGGIGAKAILRKEAAFMQDIDRIVSFDRRGTKDIVGEQFCGDCASKDMVLALAEQLGMGHGWSDGTYTDSSEWKGIVPEIVNVSVGYEGAHGDKETLNLPYLRSLADRCLIVGWDTLPVVGPAPDLEYAWDDRGDFGFGSYHGIQRNSTDPLEQCVDDAWEDVLAELGIDVFCREADAIRSILLRLGDDAYHEGYWEAKRERKGKNKRDRLDQLGRYA